MSDDGICRWPKLRLDFPADDSDSGENYRAAYSGMFDAAISDGFHGVVEKIDLGGPILSRSMIDGQQTFRRKACHIGRGDHDHVQLVYYELGSWHGDYDGRSSAGSTGGLRLADAALPMVHSSGPNRYIALSLPRDDLGADGHRIHGLSLSGKMPGVRLLTAHLRTLWTIAQELTPSEADAAVAATSVLLKGIIGGASPIEMETRAVVDRTLKAAARDYVDRHLDKSTLTPNAISAHLNVSPRTLYRIFEPNGGVAAYIQARRLDRAYDALAARVRPSIATIAYASGFVSTSHFSRAFRTRFGATPGEVHKDTSRESAAADTILAWLSGGLGRKVPSGERGPLPITRIAAAE